LGVLTPKIVAQLGLNILRLRLPGLLEGTSINLTRSLHDVVPTPLTKGCLPHPW